MHNIWQMETIPLGQSHLRDGVARVAENACRFASCGGAASTATTAFNGNSRFISHSETRQTFVVGEKSPLHSRPGSERKRLWVLKKEQRKEILPRLRVLQWHEFFFTAGLPLRRRGQHCSLLLAEEADQAFDVLGSRSQEELLTNKLHPA